MTTLRDYILDCRMPVVVSVLGVNYLCSRGWHALCGVAPGDCSCECHRRRS